MRNGDVLVMLGAIALYLVPMTAGELLALGCAFAARVVAGIVNATRAHERR